VSAVSKLSLRRGPIHGVRYHGYDLGYHPNGPHGPGAHAAVARGLLGAAEDPLRQAKEVLGRPGPLSSNLRA
jgi:hypothetical protein